jgi:hypothetical protein
MKKKKQPTCIYIYIYIEIQKKKTYSIIMIVGWNDLIDIERRTFIKHHLVCPAKLMKVWASGHFMHHPSHKDWESGTSSCK